MIHSARQLVLREKFRQIAAPAGLKEQIISEQAAQEKIIFWRPRFALAAAAVILMFGTLAFFLFPKPGADDTLAVYQNQMVGVALRGYGMDLTTNNPAQIRTYLCLLYTSPALRAERRESSHRDSGHACRRAGRFRLGAWTHEH